MEDWKFESGVEYYSYKVLKCFTPYALSFSNKYAWGNRAIVICWLLLFMYWQHSSGNILP
jgi:hypothetical protein